MSGNISSVNQTTSLTNAIAKIDMSKSDTEAKLKDLFDDKYYNGGEDSRKDIQVRIDSLNSLIKSYEKELTKYQERINRIESQIDEKADKLTGITTQISSETKQYVDDLEMAIKEAVADAINKTKQDTFSGHFSQSSFELNFKLALSQKAPNNSQISGMFNQQTALSQEIGSLCGEINSLIKDSSSMYRKVANTQATITLLTQTRNNMSQQISSLYSNKNNDSKIPVYSFEKEALIAKLADDFDSNLTSREATNETATGGQYNSRNDAKINEITNQINAFKGLSTGSGDSYSYNSGNESMRALETVLFGENNKDAKTVQEGSLVWQLAEAGANNKEIMDILVGAFGNIGLSGQNGKYTIPYGHSTSEERNKNGGGIISGRAPEIYSAVKSIANNTSGIPEPQTTTPGDPKDLKNAVSAVNQMKAAGFTFKEAMYALDQLFPNLDIGYSLGEQSNTKDGIVRFTSDSSYDELYNTIKGNTNSGENWAGSEVARREKVGGNTNLPVTGTDPISVTDGNERLYFMKQDNNGIYDGVQDLLGEKNGMQDFNTEYGKYITKNSKGEDVITGDALKNIMVMKIEENDNKKGTVGVKQSFMSAADAGITEINLSAIKDGSYNINGGEVQNTFNVKMGGKNLTGEQVVDDHDYLEATLNNSALTGEKLFSQLSTRDINRAFNDATSSNLAEGFESILDRAQSAKKTVDRLTGGTGGNDIYSIEDAFRNHLDEVWEYADWLGKTTGAKIYAENVNEYNGRDFEYGYWENDKGEALNDTITDGIMDEVMKDPLGKRNDEYKNKK